MTLLFSKDVTPGFAIHATAERLRNYLAVEKACVRINAGWFLEIRPYEQKYRLAYSLHGHSEHASWLIARLEEMRGGKANASVRPDLRRLLDEVLHAPDGNAFLRAFFGVLKRALLNQYRDDLERMDPSANANEIRILERIVADLQREMDWFDRLELEGQTCPWAEYVRSLLTSIGGIHGEATERDDPLARPHAGIFRRPGTILFDDRIRHERLVPYDERSGYSPREATIEQFKVFFNEMYAAALLASVLFDAAGDDLPWEFFADFSRHFWDEARHSEFGAIRLKELGTEPDRCDPVLFEQSEALPILHRVTYLTRGLEAYFMPRKPKRFKEYEANGDFRSQLFADQDWSDEINHVRYGSKWTDYLLEDDSREIADVLDEVKAHLSKIRGQTVADIQAPF
ncbi:MAG: DUF455 family protein [Opitutaceae bacterium]